MVISEYNSRGQFIFYNNSKEANTMNYIIGIAIIEFIYIVILVRKTARLQREIDNECSAELADALEYTSYLEHQLNELRALNKSSSDHVTKC